MLYASFRYPSLDYTGLMKATSPAYGLVKSAGFNGFHSTTVAGSGDPSRQDILKVAEQTGFPLKTATLIFDEAYEGCKEIREKGNRV